MTTADEQKIAEIRMLTERIAADRARILELIPQVFPEKHGEAPVRGRLNNVARASGFTREYVARIRDGKGPKVERHERETRAASD